MNKEIDVNVLTEDKKTYIVFNFENAIKLEITSDNSEDIKKVFYEILRYIIEHESIIFKFKKNNDDLYNDIAEKYINDLNNELIALKNDFLK